MQAQPMVFNACIVLMSVSVNAVTKHLDPGATLAEYVLLVALAVAIALLFGFAAVPGVPKPPVAQRFSDATAAMGELLGSVAARLRGDAREVGPRFRTAVRTHQDLLAPEPARAARTPLNATRSTSPWKVCAASRRRPARCSSAAPDRPSRPASPPTPPRR
ncbi:hypothetical protein AB0383_32265 [Amycolatopsis sp. NPDC051373]|uniref:hypothetical protein n=1 Tax=Amycolatopsis sp. NPDC051373 TaxID=3155801 RepID=UPI00344C8704